MDQASFPQLRLVPTAVPPPRTREGAMIFSQELPGDRLLSEFYPLADRCIDLATQHLRTPILPSLLAAFLASWLVTASTGNPWLFLGAPVLWFMLWGLGALLHHHVWSRRRFQNACAVVRAFTLTYRCSSQRMRSLWDVAWDLRSRSGRIRMFEVSLAEERLRREFPYLRDFPQAGSEQNDSPRPA